MENVDKPGRKLTAAILGTRHPHVFTRVEILKKNPSVELLGFFEENDGIAEQLATATELVRYASPESLLTLRPDLVIVESLDTEVPALAKLAAPHCRSLLLEKPGAPNREAMDDMVNYLSQFPIDVEMGYELHYDKNVPLCKEILDSNVLGQVTLARFHAGCPIGCGSELWQSVLGDLGGVMYTEGCHMLELVVYLLGRPLAVHGFVEKLPRGEKMLSDMVTTDMFLESKTMTGVQVGTLMYEDIGVAILHYPDKAATLDVTAWESGGWVENWSMEFLGTRGTLTMKLAPSELIIDMREPYGEYRLGRTVISPNVGHGMHSALHETYVDQLNMLLSKLTQDERPSQSGLRISQDVVHILDGVFSSSSTYRPTVLETR